ncbi:DUF4864 domain-containing protein [Lentibacter algarum]|nr:DUF4864 domain-containing protein [Lentibacter algarum]
MILVFGFGMSVQTHTAQADDAAIQEVITAQIDAFRADDLDKAFSFASPMIKEIFGTADNFGLMVRQSYPMVWRPERVTFGDSQTQGATIWQKVLFRDAEGKLFKFNYEMIRAGGGWQINSVSPLTLPELSV